jgi:hypothetical protein
MRMLTVVVVVVVVDAATACRCAGGGGAGGGGAAAVACVLAAATLTEIHLCDVCSRPERVLRHNGRGQAYLLAELIEGVEEAVWTLLPDWLPQLYRSLRMAAERGGGGVGGGLRRADEDEEAAAVSRSCACIGSPCLRQCVHGASLGGGGGGCFARRERVGGAGRARKGLPLPADARAATSDIQPPRLASSPALMAQLVVEGWPAVWVQSVRARETRHETWLYWGVKWYTYSSRADSAAGVSALAL